MFTVLFIAVLLANQTYSLKNIKILDEDEDFGSANSREGQTLKLQQPMLDKDGQMIAIYMNEDEREFSGETVDEIPVKRKYPSSGTSFKSGDSDLQIASVTQSSGSTSTRGPESKKRTSFLDLISYKPASFDETRRTEFVMSEVSSGEAVPEKTDNKWISSGSSVKDDVTAGAGTDDKLTAYQIMTGKLSSTASSSSTGSGDDLTSEETGSSSYTDSGSGFGITDDYGSGFKPEYISSSLSDTWVTSSVDSSKYSELIISSISESTQINPSFTSTVLRSSSFEATQISGITPSSVELTEMIQPVSSDWSLLPSIDTSSYSTINIPEATASLPQPSDSTSYSTRALLESSKEYLSTVTEIRAYSSDFLLYSTMSPTPSLLSPSGSYNTGLLNLFSVSDLTFKCRLCYEQNCLKNSILCRHKNVFLLQKKFFQHPL